VFSRKKKPLTHLVFPLLSNLNIGEDQELIGGTDVDEEDRERKLFGGWRVGPTHIAST
jgi:hypothetical protein